jgi:hypothetical protein
MFPSSSRNYFFSSLYFGNIKTILKPEEGDTKVPKRCQKYKIILREFFGCDFYWDFVRSNQPERLNIEA